MGLEEASAMHATFILKKHNLCQSSEYDSDSEEEPEQVEFRPVFVPKYVISCISLTLKLVLNLNIGEPG